MTKNNRQRRLSDHEDNPPGPAHENAFLISENADVGAYYRSRKCFVAVDNRCRKSSDAENGGVGGGASDSAYGWLMQSGWGLYVSQHSAARQPAQHPPGEAPGALCASYSCLPVHGP